MSSSPSRIRTAASIVVYINLSACMPTSVAYYNQRCMHAYYGRNDGRRSIVHPRRVHRSTDRHMDRYLISSASSSCVIGSWLHNTQYQLLLTHCCMHACMVCAVSTYVPTVVVRDMMMVLVHFGHDPTQPRSLHALIMPPGRPIATQLYIILVTIHAYMLSSTYTHTYLSTCECMRMRSIQYVRIRTTVSISILFNQ